MKQAVQLLPSLVFDGTCDEAMKFYKSVFGGELVVNYYRDMYEMPENEAHKVMHAELDTEFMTLFAGDTVPGATTTFGDNVRVCLAGSDVAKLGAYFSALAEGGAVFTPFEKQAWGQELGMLTDKFGTHWMVASRA